MQINVRVATIEDLEKITHFNQSLFTYEHQYSTSYNQGWPASSDGQAFFAKRLNQIGGFVLAAEIEDQMVGYLAIGIKMYAFRTDNPMAEIENMFVEHDYQRRGVGSQLMEEAERMCLEKGVKRIKVETLDRNIPSLNFYNKHGFSAHDMILEKPLNKEEK